MMRLVEAPYSLLEVVERELLGAEAQVAVLVEPERQRVPVGDDEPLTDVELGAVDEQRTLDVLLHDVLALLLHHRRVHQLQHVLHVVVARDACVHVQQRRQSRAAHSLVEYFSQKYRWFKLTSTLTTKFTSDFHHTKSIHVLVLSSQLI